LFFVKIQHIDQVNQSIVNLERGNNGVS